MTRRVVGGRFPSSILGQKHDLSAIRGPWHSWIAVVARYRGVTVGFVLAEEGRTPMPRAALFISTLALAAASGCGGRESGTTTGAGGTSTGTDASANLDASAVGDARIPLYHRATHATCPSQRGPGASGFMENGMPGFPACPAPPPPTTVCCSSDSSCDGGTNGRCIGTSGPFPPQNQCTYDECFTDSNCPSGTPCICRSSPTDNAANVCVSGGNCVVDSDCGPDRYCSPSPLLNSCDAPGGYYCHTAADACVDDSDCFVDGGRGRFCAYDPQARHWACGDAFCPP
jgi:hypothetical protein